MLIMLKTQYGVECGMNHILPGLCKKTGLWLFLWCFNNSLRSKTPSKKNHRKNTEDINLGGISK